MLRHEGEVDLYRFSAALLKSEKSHRKYRCSSPKSLASLGERVFIGQNGLIHFCIRRLKLVLFFELPIEPARQVSKSSSQDTFCIIGQTAFYFATTGDADTFMQAFPELELADGTLEITYTAPGFIHPLGQTRMCNVYNQTTSQEAMRRLFNDLEDRTGNLQSGQVYPNQVAPIVRHADGRYILQMARWGLPTPKSYLVGKNYDKGVTNVRNTASPHWQRWLGPEHRCLVPFDRFAEPAPGQVNQWFALPGDRQAFFAGIYVPEWTSTRKVKDGETTDKLFGFLTTDANAEVAVFHPKAMPVVLQSDADLKIWLQSGWDEAKELQRPLPDKSLELTDQG